MPVEAAMLWNEPNNKSHWDPAVDPDWTKFGELIRQAGAAIRAVNPDLPRVLGGMSPIDPAFINRLAGYGVLDAVDVVAVHGFPLDWNLWPIHNWPAKLAEIQAVTTKPVWVSEVGVSSFGAEEVQAWGLQRTAELLLGDARHESGERADTSRDSQHFDADSRHNPPRRAPRVHWYSLYDLPMAWEATTRHKEAEGSSYYRHFHMGLLREDGTPKLALDAYRPHAAEMGLCQWFHFEDHRLDDAVAWMRKLGVRYLRTGLSWADYYRPNAIAWFDRQMAALAEFDVTVTFCFTPEHKGIEPHHTSAPRDPAEFAVFCAEMVTRYAPGR